MPKRAAASTLLVAATKCSSMRVRRGRRTSARADSRVGHRLLRREGLAGDDEERLGAGATPASTTSRSAPSTLATNGTRGRGWASAGERANDHLRAEVAAADADVDDVAQARPARPPARSRTVSAKASIASRTPWTSSPNGAAPRGARSAVWSTARRSVVLIGAPASIASRCASMPHSRARSARKRSVAASTRFFDRSAKTSGASKRQRLEPARIASERLAQVEVAAVRLEVAGERRPGGGAVAARRRRHDCSGKRWGSSRMRAARDDRRSRTCRCPALRRRRREPRPSPPARARSPG